MTRGINGFLPDRLSQVLAARRISQVQLATMVGVTPPTVSKWRSGQQTPEPETLSRLASVVNVAAEWFTRPVIEKTSTPLFRSNASAHAGARTMLEARLDWAQELALVLEEFVDFPEVKLPDREFTDPIKIDSGDIEAAAQECRELWRLGSGPMPDVALALENAGIILVREETGIAQIEGLSAWSTLLKRPIVLLASDKDNGFRSRFDAAHELGHLVLHKRISRVTDPQKHKELEKQAHRFAGAFLLPAKSFSTEVRLPVTLDSLLLLKQRWGVSVAAIIMRLEALEIITEDNKLSLFKRRAARWGVKTEPGDDARLPEKPRLLKRTVELLLNSNIMSRENISRHVGLSNRDIEMLAGLPEQFLDRSAEVFELSKLKSHPKQSISRDSGSCGAVLAFNRQRS